MKIAVTSQNFRTVSGHAGKARRFLVYSPEGVELERLDLPKELSFHEWRGTEQEPHPTDGVAVIITGGAGEGFRGRLQRRGVHVATTSESDPATAVRLFLAGRLPPAAPEAHDHHHDHDHAHHHAQVEAPRVTLTRTSTTSA